MYLNHNTKVYLEVFNYQESALKMFPNKKNEIINVENQI